MLKSIKNILLIILFFGMFVFGGFAQKIEPLTILPKPTGIYAVGMLNLSLTDSSRKEKYTAKKDYRRVHLDIWYPAAQPENEKPIAYLHDFSSELIYSIFKSKGIRLGLLDTIKKSSTYSYKEASFSKSKEQFPVLIFSPGFYFGMAPLYSAFMENLASHGYIVCSISHPYEQPFIQYTDGSTAYMKKKKSQLTYLQLWLAYKLQFRKPSSPEVIEQITRKYLQRLKRFDRMLNLWITDNQFVLDYFFSEKQKNLSNNLVQKMDLSRIGAFGQSFGGAVSGQLGLRDDRIKAGLNLDGFQFGDLINEPLDKPFMLIQSGYNDLWNYGNSAIFAHPKTDFYLLSIPKARHLIFSDAALIPSVPIENRLDMLGTVDGPKTLGNINQVVLSFFNKYLLDDESPEFRKALQFDGAEILRESSK